MFRNIAETVRSARQLFPFRKLATSGLATSGLATSGLARARCGRGAFERLEQRQMLNGGPLLTAESIRDLSGGEDLAASLLTPASKQFSIHTDLPQIDGIYHTTQPAAALYGTASAADTGSVLAGGELALWSAAEGTWSFGQSGGGATSGVPLRPGVNRVIVETFDGPDGTGNRLQRGYIDVWYEDGSESTLSGNLGADTVLDAASGPWRVTGDVTVPAGVILTIQPGTTLFFDQSTGIQVDGRLVAEGTEHGRIRLAPRPGSGHTWDGIYFDSARDNRLGYADMQYSTARSASIDLDYSRIAIDNVTWAGTNEPVLSITGSSPIVRNSVFPSTSAQTVSGHRLLAADPYMLFENNVFGVCTGRKQDVLDFSTTGGATMPRFVGNLFLGGGDDALDLDGTDAYVEGNVFMNFHRNFTPTEGESYAISTGYDDGHSSHHVIVRNLLIDCDNAALVKDRSWIDFQNNTLVRCGNGVNFIEPQEDNVEAGLGGYLDGNIFWETPTPIDNYYVDDPVWGTTDITIHRSIVPAAYHAFGQGNLDDDPRLADPDNLDVGLLPGSPAIGSGPNGIDMGAKVPAGASISGEPPAVTYRTEAVLTVAGPGIRHYKYRVNDGPFGAETSVDTPIELAGLAHGDYTVHVIGRNAAGDWQSETDAAASQPWTVSPVVGRYVFYNGSAFDGDAIAVDKEALLPGRTAGFANYTSFSRGINGIMVDLRPLPPQGTLSADDFEFHMGNTNDPNLWAAAPQPTSITVRAGQGNDASDRVTLIWADNAVDNQWLRVSVLATAATGLHGPDTFYFGNAIGESGNSSTDAKVDAHDMLAARNSPRDFLNPAPIDFHFDYNRDARVNATDMLIARENQTHFLNALRLITVPDGKWSGVSFPPFPAPAARDLPGHGFIFHDVSTPRSGNETPPHSPPDVGTFSTMWAR